MSLTRKLIAAASLLVLSSSIAIAEDNGDMPPCPGGTIKGKISCTGPVLAPTCTEGPPWTCTLDKDVPTAEISNDGVRPPRFPHFETLAGGNAGVLEPATGGGGGKGGVGGTHGTFSTVLSSGGGGPTIL